MWDSFWDFIWYTIVIFAFVAYLIVLWHIITDLFRDKGASGLQKAVWVIFLIIFPYLTAIVYLLAKGKGMAERQRQAVEQAKAASDEYIRSVAGTTPTQQITEAKALLDSGAISPEEFEHLKAQALGKSA
ncbi:SHOCT domain-containing protein [Gordonia aurantiaca]|uniref:SHOCT domain-containing protein n=1 Tax=Gordonia sp. B21 TaxID=3151852 RepID=UPI0032656F4C